MVVNGEPGDLISIRDRGPLYGDGVFRTLLAVQGKAQHWPLHYQKLQHDCFALGIACPDIGMLSAGLDGLLANHPDGVLKLAVTRGQGSRGYTPEYRGHSTRFWDISPLPDYPPDLAIHVMKARLCKLRLGRQPRHAGIKHLNRLENVLPAAECNDACLLDPGISESILQHAEGNFIERNRVINWSEQHNMPLKIRNVGLNELRQADELFVVNSIIGLWPIREFAQHHWTGFPISMQIRQNLSKEYAN